MALPLSYHWRSLFARRTSTVLTILVVAAVVGVFAWMLGFAEAIRHSLSVASDEHKIIVLKRGATAESNSALPIPEYSRLAQLSDLARDPADGEPLLSPEMVTQVVLPRLRDGGRTTANVSVRGVTPRAFRVHDRIRLLGRGFSPGAPEVVVGTAAAAQFAGLAVGDKVKLGAGGNREFTVVGHFSADGGPMESEILGYLPTLMDAYNRTMYSSANLRLREGADVKAALAQIEGPSIQLTGQTEAQYWRQQARFLRLYLGIAYVLVGIMCVAAVFSVANTMFAAVAGRTREIAMLRTIGFSGRQILTGFLAEAVMLALVGGAIGCAGCEAWLRAAGATKDMFGANTFTTLAFEIRLSPRIVGTCLGAVALVGVAGAWWPARRAARVPVTAVLREA